MVTVYIIKESRPISGQKSRPDSGVSKPKFQNPSSNHTNPRSVPTQGPRYTMGSEFSNTASPGPALAMKARISLVHGDIHQLTVESTK